MKRFLMFLLYLGGASLFLIVLLAMGLANLNKLMTPGGKEFPVIPDKTYEEIK